MVLLAPALRVMWKPNLSDEYPIAEAEDADGDVHRCMNAHTNLAEASLVRRLSCDTTNYELGEETGRGSMSRCGDSDVNGSSPSFLCFPAPYTRFAITRLVSAQQSAGVFRLTLDRIVRASTSRARFPAAREEPLSYIATGGDWVESSLVI